MKVIEALKLNKELLMRIREMGVRLEDCQYVDMYSDYEEMLVKGMKTTYIVSVLADVYHISERKVYGLLKLFNADCKIRAPRKR